MNFFIVAFGKFKGMSRLDYDVILNRKRRKKFYMEIK